MKNFNLLILFSFVCHHALAEDAGNFIGTFKGEEKVVITCENASWNKSETRDWTSIHSDLNGDSFKTLTKVAGGTYNGEGTISSNTATGTFSGKDGFGNPCSGEFTDTINGDDLTAKVNGTCPSVKCDFTSKITAKRQ